MNNQELMKVLKYPRFKSINDKYQYIEQTTGEKVSIITKVAIHKAINDTMNAYISQQNLEQYIQLVCDAIYKAIKSRYEYDESAETIDILTNPRYIDQCIKELATAQVEYNQAIAKSHDQRRINDHLATPVVPNP